MIDPWVCSFIHGPFSRRHNTHSLIQCQHFSWVSRSALKYLRHCSVRWLQSRFPSIHYQMEGLVMSWRVCVMSTWNFMQRTQWMTTRISGVGLKKWLYQLLQNNLHKSWWRAWISLQIFFMKRLLRSSLPTPLVVSCSPRFKQSLILSCVVMVSFGFIKSSWFVGSNWKRAHIASSGLNAPFWMPCLLIRELEKVVTQWHYPILWCKIDLYSIFSDYFFNVHQKFYKVERCNGVLSKVVS